MASGACMRTVARNILGYVFPAFLFFLLISAGSWQTLSKTDGGVPSLALESQEGVIKADFKGTRDNPDGSLDLIFRVSREKKSAYAVGQGQGRDGASTEKSVTTPRTQMVYPMTIEAQYVINTPNMCSNEDQVDILIIVHSATAYSDRRRAIRETYGSSSIFSNVTQRVVFMLGTTTDLKVTKSIEQEALQYRDIVQGRFHDSYHNLTLKGVMGFRWAVDFCPQARVIVKIDDDVFINPFRLVSYVLSTFGTKPQAAMRRQVVEKNIAAHDYTSALKGTERKLLETKKQSKDKHAENNTVVGVAEKSDPKKQQKAAAKGAAVKPQTHRHFACHLRRAGTSLIERGKGKWKVHEDEFRGHDSYPFDYCNGYFVAMTSDLLQPLLRAVQLNPFFWIDDVYLFGMLPATVGGVTFVDLRQNLTTRYDHGKTCLEKNGFQCQYLAVSQFKDDGFDTLWQLLLTNVSDTVASNFGLFQSS